MKCPLHPRYQAKRKPRLPCEPCWRKWIWEQDIRNQGGHEAVARSMGLDKESMDDWHQQLNDWINSPG